MNAFNRFGTCFGVAVLLGAMAPACGSGGETTGTSSNSSSSGGGSTTSSAAGGGGTGGTSGSTSTTSSGTGGTGTGGTGGTGTGGAGSGAHGPPANQLVNGGDVVTSPGYKMVFTLGQPTQNQTKTTSRGYRMQGGLMGATGTSP